MEGNGRPGLTDKTLPKPPQIPLKKRRVKRYACQEGETGRSRNLVIPDSLYDRLCRYALRVETEVKPEKKTVIDGVEKIIPPVYRSPNVSEAACIAIDFYLRNKKATDDDESSDE